MVETEPVAGICPETRDSTRENVGPKTFLQRVFVVSGLDCAAEVRALEGELLPLLDGDRSRLGFDVLAGRMTVFAGAAELPDRAVLAAVSRAGLRAEPLGDAQSGTSRRARHGRLAATVVSGAGTLAGVLVHGMAAGSVLAPLGLTGTPSAAPAAAAALYLLGTAAGLLYVAPRAWSALRAFRGDMHLLMTVAVAGAVGLGEYLEAASVTFLFSVSLLLESWSVARARRAIQALMELAPPRARRRESGGGEAMVALHEVSVGESIVVHAGERVPLDGTVVEGIAHVDSSPLTGEGVPVEAESGIEVFAGSVCLDGTLVVQVQRPAADTLLARIVRRVTEARKHRARAEQWVERFARVYTPIVFALAALTALMPPLLGAGPWQEWLYRSLVLLVIGCPCALVISTPVAVVAGLTAAARNGVLIKGGNVLELPARLGVVAFDKTGTLTAGELRVARVVPFDGHTSTEVLTLAAGLNERSSHPIGRAIVSAARAQGLSPAPSTGARVLPGRGVEGWIQGTTAWVGSSRLLQERDISTRNTERFAVEAGTEGNTVVFVGKADRICGLIALADTPRTEAAAAIAALAEIGMTRLVLLTGDTPEAAHTVGAAVGIADRFSRLLPEDKVRVVDRLRFLNAASSRTRRSLVAFVGDGVNDAPALAAADLGIAIGDGGTDVALETSDVALLKADLSRIPWLIQHSRRVVAVIRANIAFALAIKILFAVLAATGYATLWAAIVADMGASLLVIANGLRLLGTHHEACSARAPDVSMVAE